MRTFAYERPQAVADAVAAAAEPDAMFLAGGTNLVDLMKLGVAQPTLLVDVAALPFDRIEEQADGGLRIGATVSNTDLAAHRAVRARFPVLAQALAAGASGQVRNRATVAGNLLQRTRCSYFQDVTKPCNKRAPGSGCPAREGEHHNLAIFGHSASCVATHPSDMAVAMTALDAEVEVEGPRGRRTLPLGELHRLPGDRPDRDTMLEHGELITAIALPPMPAGSRASYRKVRDRASFAFALVSVAAVVELDGDTIRRCRIAFGGLAHRPWRAALAEQALAGAPASAASFAKAADAELAGADPLRDNAYKVTLARNLLVRQLSDLCERP